MSLVPPKLEFVEATETSLTVQFPPPSGGVTVQLQWKEHACPTWEQGGGRDVPLDGSATATDKLQVQAGPLEPGKSYQLRLVYARGAETATGPEVFLDTEQVGCTPKPNRGCSCTIQ